METKDLDQDKCYSKETASQDKSSGCLSDDNSSSITRLIPPGTDVRFKPLEALPEDEKRLGINAVKTNYGPAIFLENDDIILYNNLEFCKRLRY